MDLEGEVIVPGRLPVVDPRVLEVVDVPDRVVVPAVGGGGGRPAIFLRSGISLRCLAVHAAVVCLIPVPARFHH